MKTAFEQLMTGLDEVQSFLARERKGFKLHLPDEVDVKSKLSIGQGPFTFFRHKRPARPSQTSNSPSAIMEI